MPLNITISGSTGLIGRALTDHFCGQGHKVIPLGHLPPWSLHMLQAKLEAQDIVIHLAGVNISERWTKDYKMLIQSSRVETTCLLSKALVSLKQKPRLYICASAIGYYGNHPAGIVLDEDSPVGEGFLPEVCRQWEDATLSAFHAGIRVVNMRTAVVLGKNGGALARMLPIFNLGLGGILGNGEQMISWIALDEIPLIVDHIIQTGSLSGPVNVVAPEVLSNREFTSILSEIIKRPAFLPLPAWGVKLLFGEMGQQLLLEGAQVRPARLQSSGYVFKYPDIRSVMQKVLNSAMY
ncbi:MAG: TIGR01777 family protein [Candidatus Omnitrophica bacterium]|nr:TIGR01777 family protein [Candidatus Omnitrophota bacterium]